MDISHLLFIVSGDASERDTSGVMICDHLISYRRFSPKDWQQADPKVHKQYTKAFEMFDSVSDLLIALRRDVRRTDDPLE